MKITSNKWNKYIKKLSSLSRKAGEEMRKWVERNGIDNVEDVIRYANALVTKYGEGSSALACQMYEAIAELEGKRIKSAEPADVASYGEVAKAINGSLIQSSGGNLIDSVVERLVKQAGADTTMKNAIRDGAEFAWIPDGESCSFCLTLASRGWQRASRKALRNGHAEHIHAHCECEYAIRFSKDTEIEGYEPDELYQEYKNAADGTTKDKINAIRRMKYAENKEKINEQHREAYARRNEESTS